MLLSRGVGAGMTREAIAYFENVFLSRRTPTFHFLWQKFKKKLNFQHGSKHLFIVQLTKGYKVYAFEAKMTFLVFFGSTVPPQLFESVLDLPPSSVVEYQA